MSIRKKRARLTLLGAALVAAAVALNLLLGCLPASVTRLDATQGSLITPSEALEQAADAVTQPVTIYYYASQGGTDSLLDSLVRRVEERNDLIEVRRLLPGTAGDDIVSRYAADGLPENSLIVVSPLRAYVISNDSLVVTQYNQTYYYYYGQYVVESQDDYADSLLAFALEYTSREDLPVVYQLTGHGETALESLAREELARRFVALETLDLGRADAVPEDALALILNAPTQDITPEESGKLLSYLKAGGRLLLTTCYNAAELPNLADVTAYYGLQALGGLVQDPAPGYHYSDTNGAYNHYMKPVVQQSEALSSLAANEGLALCVAQSHALTTGTIARDTLTVEPLLKTSEQAYRKVNLDKLTTLDQEEGDDVGAFTLAASASEGDARLVWIASGMVLSDNSALLSASGNLLLFDEALGWMAGLPEPREENGVSLILSPLEQTGTAVPVVKALLIGLPLCVLLLGLLASRKPRSARR